MQLVTGHLLYNPSQYGEVLTPDLPIRIGYLNQLIEAPADSFGNDAVNILLRKCGILQNDILYTLANINIKKNKIEIFFAYQVAAPLVPARPDVWLFTAHHRFGSYAAYQGLIIPAFNNIQTDWKSLVINLATKYQIQSFMVKPVAVPELPELVLAKAGSPGELADMRNIINTQRFVQQFKLKNFNIIWFQDASGKVGSTKRPAGGWKI